MAEAPRSPDLPDLPEAVSVPERRRSMQLIWLIPIVAALIGGWLAVKTYLERGPLITITFANGEGLEAGKTKIKYKSVDIGTVTSVALSEDRQYVVAMAELTNQAASFLVEDTRFWVVRPRIAGGQVSGLGTLLAGSYIGADAGKSSKRRDSFQGLEIPPIVTADLPGREFSLRSQDAGSLEVGSPIYFRRLQVGQVTAYELDADGKGITTHIFIHAPYDQYVTDNTRFWHASGVDVTLDASGIQVDTQSVVSMLIGGIAFQTPPGGEMGRPAEKGAQFTLYGTHAEALKRPDTRADTYLLAFDQSVRGLAVGAPVDFRGVNIGEVTAIDIGFDDVRRKIIMLVEVRVYPDRMRSRARDSRDRETSEDPRETVKQMVAGGLRAQLRSGNLITGQLYVAIDFFPDAKPVQIDWNKSPIELPTMPGSLEELQTIVANVAKKLDKVPLDRIGSGAEKAVATLNETLKSADKLVQRLDSEVTPEARKTLEEARRTLGAAEKTLAADAPLQADVRETLREVAKAAAALRALADYLERHPEALVRGKPE